MRVKKQQLEPHMEPMTGSELEKEYVKAVCCHLAQLTSVQSRLRKMPGWMNHKLESRFPGERSRTPDMRVIELKMAKCEEELKRPMMRVKE